MSGLAAPIRGGTDERLVEVATLPISELLKLCQWPAAVRFAVHDMPGDHDPCYVVQPGGAMLPLNHWNDELTDVARATFMARACNSLLAEAGGSS